MADLTPRRLQLRDRVLFDEDGCWTMGTVVESLTAPGHLAIKGDRGGIHSGGRRLDDLDWVIPLRDILAHFEPYGEDE